MAGRVRDIDRGWNHIKRELSRTKDAQHTVVGITGKDSDRYGDDAEFSNVEVGAVHEFGSLDGKIPQRSFLRATLDTNKDSYRKLAKKLMQMVIGLKMSRKTALGIMGAKVKADVISRINAGIAPELDDDTIDARKRQFGKSSSKPLIATGQLKQSISWEVRDR